MSGVKRLIRQRRGSETHNKTHMAKLALHYDTSVNLSRLPTEEAERGKAPAKNTKVRLFRVA